MRHEVLAHHPGPHPHGHRSVRQLARDPQHPGPRRRQQDAGRGKSRGTPAHRVPARRRGRTGHRGRTRHRRQVLPPVLQGLAAQQRARNLQVLAGVYRRTPVVEAEPVRHEPPVARPDAERRPAAGERLHGQRRRGQIHRVPGVGGYDGRTQLESGGSRLPGRRQHAQRVDTARALAQPGVREAARGDSARLLGHPAGARALFHDLHSDSHAVSQARESGPNQRRSPRRPITTCDG